MYTCEYNSLTNILVYCYIHVHLRFTHIYDFTCFTPFLKRARGGRLYHMARPIGTQRCRQRTNHQQQLESFPLNVRAVTCAPFSNWLRVWLQSNAAYDVLLLITKLDTMIIMTSCKL